MIPAYHEGSIVLSLGKDFIGTVELEENTLYNIERTDQWPWKLVIVFVIYWLFETQ